MPSPHPPKKKRKSVIRAELKSLDREREDFCSFCELDISRRPTCELASTKQLLFLPGCGLLQVQQLLWWGAAEKEAVFQGRAVFLGLEEEGFFLCEGKDEDVIQSSGPVKKLKFGTVQEADHEGNKARGLASRRQTLKTPLVLVQLQNRTPKFSQTFSSFAPFYYKSPATTHICFDWFFERPLLYSAYSFSLEKKKKTK